MNTSDRRARRWLGHVHPGLAAAVGVIAVIAAVLFVFRPDVGNSPDAEGAAAPDAVPASVQSVPPSTSPRQLPAPYAYRDAGQELLVLGRPASASADPADMYPSPVQVNRAGAERAASAPGGGTLDVTLPDGTRYPVAFERAESGPGGNWTWIGRVESHLGELAAVLTYGRDGVFGVLPAPDGRLFQIQTSNGSAYLQPDPGLAPPGSDPDALPPDFRVPPQQRLADPASPPGTQPDDEPLHKGGQATANPGWSGMVAPADDATVTITVLGVYTKNLVTQRGSVAAAETEMVSALAISNQAHVDSGTPVRFEYVDMVETDYPGHLHNDVFLDAITDNDLPDGKDIHALRNATGADLVTVLRPYAGGDPTCGIAWLAGSGMRGTNTSPDYGYSVNSCGAYTMAHELGHNLGSNHDRETSTSNGVLGYGAFEYSFGYRQLSPVSFATIMAYTQSGQPRIGYFSAPGNTLCLGNACGIAGQSDNVRSIKQMAETISRFRDPPNTISVMDAAVVEPYGAAALLRFQVRLSTPAPVGGVKFDIATTSNGTATPGVDFVARSESGRTIPAGQTEWWFEVSVLADELVEGDETVHVALSNVSGMTVYDAEAIGLIRDDDPRATVSGKLVFPQGTPASASATIFAEANYEGVVEEQQQVVTAPDYKYAFKIMRGSSLQLTTSFADADPWVGTTEELGKVDGDMTHDLTAVRGLVLTGRVKWPQGQTAPTSRMIVWAWNAHRDNWAPGVYVYPPDYRYTFKIRPGVGVGLATQDAPAPYVDQRFEFSAEADVVQDITLATLPSLTIAHQRVEEGPAGMSRSFSVPVVLSVPSSSDVTFNVATEDDSATAGADYQAVSQGMTIAKGSTRAWLTVTVRGDNVPEPDERFRIVATNIQGAHMPSPGVIRILDDDQKGLSDDFDGDGRSELVWRHSTLGRAALWGGAQYAAAWNLLSVRDMEWRIVGMGDFDRDRKADLLWRHRTTGRNTIWRSADHATQLSMATLAGVDWEVAGVGDFDGDGQSDVLWHHAVTGANVIWRGGDATATLPVTRITDTDWRIVGVGDFDGDGRSDILWRHARTGGNVIWRSGDYGTQLPVVGVTDQRWVVAGVGDFDADGKDDVLWLHETTGASVVWHAGNRNDQKSLTKVTDRNWDIVAVGDYDGDGVADVVWRNGWTGANALWLGGEYRNQLPVVGVRDTAWRIVH